MVLTTAEYHNAATNLEEEKVVLTTAEYQNAAANLDGEKVYSQVEKVDMGTHASNHMLEKQEQKMVSM